MLTSLPLELLRMIFLQAAESSTSFCRTLCEVSSWVRHLALPLLYRTVVIDCIERLVLFNRSITSGPLACPPNPTFRPADAVRHLWVPFASETLKDIVRHCENVTHLAICPHDLAELSSVTTSSTPEHQGPPSGTRVQAEMGDLHVVLFPHNYASGVSVSVPNSLFARITHLRLEEAMGLPLWQLVTGLPRLTHLAAPFRFLDEDYDWIFDKIPGTSIKVFVMVLIYMDKSERREVEDSICKSRKEHGWLYTVRQRDRLEEEWDVEVRGGTTIWERAAEHTRLLMSRA